MSLQHCLPRLAKRYGVKIQVEKENFMDESGLMISIIPGSGDGVSFTRELEAALAFRNGRLLGYLTWIVLHPVSAVSVSSSDDIFKGLPGCAALDRKYKTQPDIDGVLKMLGRCMKDVTGRYGNTVYAETTIMNPDNIQIVILDSVAGKTIVEDIENAVALRGKTLFGHSVTVSVMDPDYRK